ncbi:hypothetical protein [Streptomyces prasinopilosus]|uniref:hypothetical protein n=1 Tax=Streptomyces prasinopilosus TaxID=67344 RepID=UPI0006EBC1E5|nr:hypothetical protein [Streptomyces prasinopilosus]
MSLRPSQLPKVRRQTLRHLRDSASPLRAKTSPESALGLDALATILEAGDLFWVQQDMAALSVHAGEQLAAARWATPDRPAPCGLLFWQDGIGHMDAQGVQIPVEACAWGPYQGEMLLWLLMSRDRLVAESAAVRPDLTLVTEEIPPLVPVSAATIPVTANPLPMVEVDPGLPQPVVAALASAWLLMQQPLLIDRTRECADKPTARAHARDGLPAPEVTVVDLRRQYTPQDQDPDAGTDGRRYRHRWVVSGHWRTYQSDRYSEETRGSKQWIPSYVKGPEGAPLLSTEKVNVWRR